MRNSDMPLATEHQEQAMVIQWWDLQFPHLSRLLFAIPNGGFRAKVTAAYLKKEGVKPGVADLFLAISAYGYHGLFIEMKRIKGARQSREQKEFQKAVTSAGYKYVLAKGWEEAMKAIMVYMSDTQTIKTVTS